MNLFCGHSVPYSQTWPASGSMRNGVCSERPPLALPTSADGSSSSPGLPTPRARDSRGRGFSDQLPNVIELLPTPTVSEANGIGHAADGGMNLRHTISLLPTPRASENENRQTKRSPSQEAGTHGKCLAAEVAHLLPTPTATPYGNNQSPSAGAAVRPSLDSLAPTLLPTPRVAATRTGRSAILNSSSSPSLEQAVELANGQVPRELTSLAEAPPSWRGGSTSPLSDAGNTSSDDLPPPQPTLWDD
jgi:hypothetical protein